MFDAGNDRRKLLEGPDLCDRNRSLIDQLHLRFPVRVYREVV
jgi:hypothetical protein